MRWISSGTWNSSQEGSSIAVGMKHEFSWLNQFLTVCTDTGFIKGKADDSANN